MDFEETEVKPEVGGVGVIALIIKGEGEIEENVCRNRDGLRDSPLFSGKDLILVDLVDGEEDVLSVEKKNNFPDRIDASIHRENQVPNQNVARGVNPELQSKEVLRGDFLSDYEGSNQTVLFILRTERNSCTWRSTLYGRGRRWGSAFQSGPKL